MFSQSLLSFIPLSHMVVLKRNSANILFPFVINFLVTINTLRMQHREGSRIMTTQSAVLK